MTYGLHGKKILTVLKIRKASLTRNVNHLIINNYFDDQIFI